MAVFTGIEPSGNIPPTIRRNCVELAMSNESDPSPILWRARPETNDFDIDRKRPTDVRNSRKRESDGNEKTNPSGRNPADIRLFVVKSRESAVTSQAEFRISNRWITDISATLQPNASS